jgi:hypothetical protein
MTHKNHSQARGREKELNNYLESRGSRIGNSKHTHWCEGEDLKEHLEQELETGGEELHQIFIKHT